MLSDVGCRTLFGRNFPKYPEGGNRKFSLSTPARGWRRANFEDNLPSGRFGKRPLTWESREAREHLFNLPGRRRRPARSQFCGAGRFARSRKVSDRLSLLHCLVSGNATHRRALGAACEIEPSAWSWGAIPVPHSASSAKGSGATVAEIDSRGDEFGAPSDGPPRPELVAHTIRLELGVWIACGLTAFPSVFRERAAQSQLMCSDKVRGRVPIDGIGELLSSPTPPPSNGFTEGNASGAASFAVGKGSWLSFVRFRAAMAVPHSVFSAGNFVESAPNGCNASCFPHRGERLYRNGAMPLVLS